MSNYPRGSRWRKWDLQVHTPFSYLNNGFGNEFDIYVKNLFLGAIEKDIAVIGVTDYFCVEGYKKLKKEYLENEVKLAELFSVDQIKRIRKIKLFPNIEFRLDTLVNGNRVNFHVLFSDELTLEGIEENFLHELDFIYEGSPQGVDENWKLKIANIEALGRKLKNEQPELGDSDLFVGMKCAVVSHAQITKILREKRSKFNGKYLFCVPCDEDLSNLAWNSQDHNIRKVYIQKADLLISANPKTIAWGLGKKHESEQAYIDEFKSLKPCVWGSDSHDYEKLFEPDQERHTWIKADPTFEGLRQVGYEPEERVKIQTNNPYEDKRKLFFNEIVLTGSTNFVLPDFVLPLNRELVTLIGGRGAGKTALLDVIAFLNEEHVKADQNNKKKIIEYYRDNENRVEPRPALTLRATLIDKDGNSSEFEKKLDDKSNLQLPFLYLGQEQLSRIATNDFELTKTICELIGIDVGQIGQDALITKARSILSDIWNVGKQAEDIVEKYIELGYTSGTDIVEWINNYRLKLVDQQKRLSSKETRTVLEGINKKTEQGLKLKELLEKAKNIELRMRDIDLNADISNFNADLRIIYPEHAPLGVLDVKTQQVFLNELQAEIKLDMDKLRKEIFEQKNELLKQGIKEDVNSLLQASEGLQRQISEVEKDRNAYSEAGAKIRSLHTERGSVLTAIKDNLDLLRTAITDAYKNFEASREDSTSEEKELFENLIKSIGVEGSVEFNFRKFSHHVLENFLDNRRMANEVELKKTIAGENLDGTPKEVSFETLSTWIQSDLSNQKFFSRGGLEGLTEYIFTDWPDFLSLKAIAKLNGKPTEVLSIGQRGTLLLKVYLATSSARQIFMIDQPEDNLDNSFIMHELVPLIRKAKKSRQIILSTHNANLVVNADADQVIIAQLDQGTGYISGSIENSEINKQVREILEGGERAFMQRERKYSLIK